VGNQGFGLEHDAVGHELVPVFIMAAAAVTSKSSKRHGHTVRATSSVFVFSCSSSIYRQPSQQGFPSSFDILVSGFFPKTVWRGPWLQIGSVHSLCQYAAGFAAVSIIR